MTQTQSTARYTLCAPNCYPRSYDVTVPLDEARERYQRAVRWATAGQYTPPADKINIIAVPDDK